MTHLAALGGTSPLSYEFIKDFALIFLFTVEIFPFTPPKLFLNSF